MDHRYYYHGLLQVFKGMHFSKIKSYNVNDQSQNGIHLKRIEFEFYMEILKTNLSSNAPLKTAIAPIIVLSGKSGIGEAKIGIHLRRIEFEFCMEILKTNFSLNSPTKMATAPIVVLSGKSANGEAKNGIHLRIIEFEFYMEILKTNLSLNAPLKTATALIVVFWLIRLVQFPA